ALEHRRARREARRLAALLGPPQPPPRRPMAVGPPSVVGEWSGKTHIDVTGIHAILLPTGRVLFFNYGPSAEGIAAIWDPETGARRRVDPPGGDNLWCGGQTLLADGRVLVAGGNAPKTSDLFNGLDTIYTFDPWTETWMFQGRMNEGRWYPTTTTLPDGRVLITSGRMRDGSGNINEDVDVFTPNPDPTKRGTVQTVARRWLNMYPLQHVIRDGRVLVSGPSGVDVGIFNPANWGFTPLPHRPYGNHTKGSAVLLPDGPGGSSKVMTIGGVGEDEVEIIDAADLGAGWRRRAPLPQTRRNTNSVLTPDGAVITIGGNLEENYISPQKEALRYDPAANTWTPMAAQAEERGYHSTALLLPDGRIMSAGDDGPSDLGGQSDEIEVFSPPYLFKGPRPQITSAPDAVPYGSAFGVGTPDGDVAKAVLVAPGATTHANDMHQRLVPLAMTRTAGGLQLTAPATTSIAPPGHYMLFLVDSAGVPSVARFVHLAPTAPPAPPDPPPLPPPGPGGGTTAPGAVAPGRVTAPRVTPAGTVLAPLAPRAYWREGFENQIKGVPNTARVRAAFSGRRGLRLDSETVVPGPALLAGTYRATLRVRSGGA
ncbi:MAG TPA: galactose oxidase-like domain-containing protein, partial [Miltoncostaeaceae bacterium]|nr:galactose oxidase-like domain-containing protein [Miltoncostaeaceae bacterium]